MPVPVEHGRTNGHSSSETQLAFEHVATLLLKRANLFVGLEGRGYKVERIRSERGKKSAIVVTRDIPGGHPVAAIVYTEGKSPRPSLFGNLPDGTLVEVSIGQATYHIDDKEYRYPNIVPIYRTGDAIKDNGPWTMFFSAEWNPYLEAVGI